MHILVSHSGKGQILTLLEKLTILVHKPLSTNHVLRIKAVGLSVAKPQEAETPCTRYMGRQEHLQRDHEEDGVEVVEDRKDPGLLEEPRLLRVDAPGRV